MKSADHSSADDVRIADAASAWVLRQDRGLSAEEQDLLSQWLAADPRHRAVFSEHSRGWDELDHLAGLQCSLRTVPNPDLLAPNPALVSRRLIRFAPFVLAAAAAIAIGFLFRPATPAALPSVGIPRSPFATMERRILSDGSKVQLNRGSVFSMEFTPEERRVRLVRGEASFVVAKNPLRPFVVIVQGVRVCAVGTVFNVRLESAAVEVLVTEGKVVVEKPGKTPAGVDKTLLPPIRAGEHAIVPLAPSAPVPIATRLSTAQIEEALAWQPRLLDFADAPLAEIAAEFNRHNPVRLVLEDPSLREMRLSASFRSDNIEGFVRLMESDFNIRADRRSETEIRLHR
ncbi:MAG: FecR family protein [Verrucomicrobia bacterium]|nr:FecR family protein [Verrucomicrobiota bacterium]